MTAIFLKKPVKSIKGSLNDEYRYCCFVKTINNFGCKYV